MSWRSASVAVLLVAAAFARAQGPTLPPPRAVVAADSEQDHSGTELNVRWEAPKVGPPEGWELVGYAVEALGADGEPAGRPEVVRAPFEGPLEATVCTLRPGRAYIARVTALYAPAGADWLAPGEEPAKEAPVGGDAPAAAKVRPLSAVAVAAAAASPVGLWYDAKRTNSLIGVVVLCSIFVLAMSLARRREVYVRPIAGLQAVDDAIGRATEMGRPILYVSGLGGLGGIATLASIFILGHLARRTAPYETEILVPANDPLVMAVEREVVREAYTEAGRPDVYKEDNIYYTTDSQFGYVAAVDGVMMREKPAVNFYMGYFAAESLILAETGSATGAVQIAGTDQDNQLPFFITTCDYTLMGEELYAAGAYLSRAPVLLAQLKGQDIGKALIVLLLLAGAIAVSVCAFTNPELVTTLLDLLRTEGS